MVDGLQRSDAIGVWHGHLGSSLLMEQSGVCGMTVSGGAVDGARVRTAATLSTNDAYAREQEIVTRTLRGDGVRFASTRLSPIQHRLYNCVPSSSQRLGRHVCRLNLERRPSRFRPSDGFSNFLRVDVPASVDLTVS